MTLRCTSNSKLSARLVVTDSEWICSHFKHGNCIRCFFVPQNRMLLFRTEKCSRDDDCRLLSWHDRKGQLIYRLALVYRYGVFMRFISL